jgi:hypothetical protein
MKIVIINEQNAFLRESCACFCGLMGETKNIHDNHVLKMTALIMVAEGPLGRWLMGNQIPGAVGIIASLKPVPPPWI